jgi:probable rRNA maturation factor
MPNPAPPIPAVPIDSVPVLVRNLQRAVRIDRHRLQRAAEAILAAVQFHEAELGFLLVSDRRMRALNARYRNTDRSTDVLAFPLHTGRPGPSSFLLGDIVIAVPTAKRQAMASGQSLYNEIVRLLIHGVVHLLGFDHERGFREAARMVCKERAILRRLRKIGIGVTVRL